MAILVDVTMDTILGSDAVSLSLIYHRLPSVDGLTALDEITLNASYNVKPQDSIVVTDSAFLGFVRWASPSDEVSLSDSLGIAVSYNITNLDEVSLTDKTHIWKPSVDGTFQTSLEGGSNLAAVLVKKNTSIPTPQAAPPRSVVLPKQPVQLVEHNTINLDPTRN